MMNEPAPDFDSLDIRIYRSRRQKYRGAAKKALVYAQGIWPGARESEAYIADLVLPNAERRSEVLPELPDLRPTVGPKNYGTELFNWLFPEKSDTRSAFRQVRWSAESYTRLRSTINVIRLRLWLDPEAPELHLMRWESLRDPDRDEPLSLTLAFSRFMHMPDMPDMLEHRVVHAPPLRMLFITANPKNLDRFDLSEINVALENRIVRGATERFGDQVVIERLETTASLDEIRNARAGEFHIAHILAHAMAEGDDGCLLLPDAEGRAQRVGGAELTAALVGSERPPYLVILTTPVTAAEREGAVFLKLAPLLIQKGVQAVLAVQAPIRAERLRLFVERFYAGLLQNGNIDQAVADARVAIYKSDEWDWSFPVLFVRTFEPRMFVSERTPFDDLLGPIQLTRL